MLVYSKKQARLKPKVEPRFELYYLTNILIRFWQKILSIAMFFQQKIYQNI